MGMQVTVEEGEVEVERVNGSRVITLKNKKSDTKTNNKEDFFEGGFVFQQVVGEMMFDNMARWAGGVRVIGNINQNKDLIGG